MTKDYKKSKEQINFKVLLRSPKYPAIVISEDDLFSAYNIKQLGTLCVLSETFDEDDKIRVSYAFSMLFINSFAILELSIRMMLPSPHIVLQVQSSYAKVSTSQQFQRFHTPPTNTQIQQQKAAYYWRLVVYNV